MANNDAPRGFVPVSNAYGAPWTGAPRRYYIASGEAYNLFIGDPVALSGSGDAFGVPGIVRATAGAGSSAGDGPVGVVVGFENLTSDNLSRTYRLSGVAGYVLVIDDPNALYEIQEDSVGGAISVDSIGLNANFIIGTGNTATGTSAVELDSNTAAVTATLDCRIIGISPRIDNEVGDFAKWLVKLNNHPHLVLEGE
jgi:hypothetical protein